MTKICSFCKKTELKPGQLICDACLETHIELLLSRFEPGMKLIKEGRCPRGYTAPLACWLCPTGHATECHYPQTCNEAQCSHYMREMPEEL